MKVLKARNEGEDYGGPQLSRQNQKHHGKTKNLTAKPKTSRQNQKPFDKTKYFTAKQNSFGFAVRYLAFAVKHLVLPCGLWFCREVFCFCREVFGFAVRYFVRWGFWFCRHSCGPPKKNSNLVPRAFPLKKWVGHLGKRLYEELPFFPQG